MSAAESVEGSVESGWWTSVCRFRWPIRLHLGHYVTTDPLQTSRSCWLRQWGRLPPVRTNQCVSYCLCSSCSTSL